MSSLDKLADMINNFNSLYHDFDNISFQEYVKDAG